MKKERQKGDRRVDERRAAERRRAEQRKAKRRTGERRKENCPTCGKILTAASYCRSCKVRVIRIRSK